MTPIFELSCRLFLSSDARGCENRRNLALRSGPIVRSGWEFGREGKRGMRRSVYHCLHSASSVPFGPFITCRSCWGFLEQSCAADIDLLIEGPKFTFKCYGKLRIWTPFELRLRFYRDFIVLNSGPNKSQSQKPNRTNQRLSGQLDDIGIGCAE